MHCINNIYCRKVVIRIKTTSLESFRKFMISITCKSLIPSNYNGETDMFSERDTRIGDMYIEAVDKIRVKKLKEITFVNAKEVLGIIYSSRTGNTLLKWRLLKNKTGKVIGKASPNAVANWVESRLLTTQWSEHCLKFQKQDKELVKYDTNKK